MQGNNWYTTSQSNLPWFAPGQNTKFVVNQVGCVEEKVKNGQFDLCPAFPFPLFWPISTGGTAVDEFPRQTSRAVGETCAWRQQQHTEDRIQGSSIAFGIVRVGGSVCRAEIAPFFPMCRRDWMFCVRELAAAASAIGSSVANCAEHDTLRALFTHPMCVWCWKMPFAP